MHRLFISFPFICVYWLHILKACRVYSWPCNSLCKVIKWPTLVDCHQAVVDIRPSGEKSRHCRISNFCLWIPWKYSPDGPLLLDPIINVSIHQVESWGVCQNAICASQNSQPATTQPLSYMCSKKEWMVCNNWIK